MDIKRRNFIKTAGALSAYGLIAGWPILTFANLPTDNRFIFVILRGALDGLAAVPPYGDADYKEQRRGLAFGAPGATDGALDLDGFFGLNPALDSLLPLYKQGNLAVFHAVASPYRERSHFDAQNLLENGTIRPGGTDGWLNRALQALGAGTGSAIALNQQIPLVLQGNLEVASWAPKNREIDMSGDYMTKIKKMYGRDPVLAGAFAEGVQTQDMAAQSLSRDDAMSAGNAKGTEQLYAAAKAAAVFLSQDNGPRVAVLEAGGWDTHARQGTVMGQLYNRLSDLGKALAVLPSAMGDKWQKTVVVVVTEFGRTVAQNGTDGTDHGTGAAAFVLGGRVRGGKVYGQWPGLSAGNLYQGRDLMPTTDMRSILKTVLYTHLNARTDALENTIFPDSSSAVILKQLLA